MVHFTYNNSEETRLKELARLREKTLHDEASALGKAEAIGMAKGKTETKSAIIANMKAMGMTDEQIKALLPE